MSQPAKARPSRLIDYLTLAQEHLATKGVESARLDAELLLAEALGLSRVELYTNHDRPLGDGEVDRFRVLLRRRAAREPVAYITGRREFWSLDFAVDRRVLIPRPETELLVDIACRALRGELASGNGDRREGCCDAQRVLEIGTGSGAVAVALALEVPSAYIVASDCSASALEIAPLNARTHGVADRVSFVQHDAFEGLDADPPFDLVLSNPPYCKEHERAELEPEVREWEPPGALFAGHDGMEVTARIVDGAPRYLRTGGWLLLEVGTQAAETRDLLTRSGWTNVKAFRDLAGIERVVAARTLHSE